MMEVFPAAQAQDVLIQEDRIFYPLTPATNTHGAPGPTQNNPFPLHPCCKRGGGPGIRRFRGSMAMLAVLPAVAPHKEQRTDDSALTAQQLLA